MIVFATGHRPEKLGGYNIPNPIYTYVYNETIRILRELKPTKTISGMALGFDQLFSRACIDLDIPFIAAIPFSGQERKWPKESQDEYYKILAKAYEVVTVSSGGYHPKKMQIRNEWMVNNGNKGIACFDGTEGGTYNCVRYAIKHEKEIFYIDPRKA